MGGFAASIFVKFQPAKLTAIFIVVSWIPLLVIHEAGHAFFARIFGAHIEKMVVGFGRPIWNGTVGGVPIEVRIWPISGFVSFLPGSRGLGRLRRATISLAGPGAELAVVAIIAVGIGPAELIQSSQDISRLFLQSLCVAALVDATVNLIPHSFRDENGSVSHPVFRPNDGLSAIRSLTGRDR